MSGLSRYTRNVAALLAGFVLFCAGRFSVQVTATEPWQVNTAQRPAAEAASLEENALQEEYPESLLPGEVININTADVYDLQRLPGIGEKRARDIVAYREEHGAFQTVDDLDFVAGIGPGILGNLREYAVTGNE